MNLKNDQCQAWEEEIARLKEVLDSYGNMEVKLDLLSGENEKLQKENEELKKALASARHEIATAVNFMDSMGWNNCEKEESDKLRIKKIKRMISEYENSKDI